jgi:hypothetical protein
MKISLRQLVAWNGALEAIVGFVFFIQPSLPSQLIFGTPVAGVSGSHMLLGAALLTFGYTCWVARKAGPIGLHAVGRGLQAYNLLAAFILAYVAISPFPHGPLAWPGVLLHVVLWVAFALALKQDLARLRAEQAAAEQGEDEGE